ncbi:MAG: TonB-dependent receptor plug domain-containing protein [Candidatus Acidiferrales bacterium]
MPSFSEHGETASRWFIWRLAHRDSNPANVAAKLCRDLAIVGTIAILTFQAAAQERQVDLTKESMKDLMNVEVTSVSKREQRLSQTASAVFVITQADIQRSGATNIPDLLRMAPGLNVAQINANTWAITARGFNSRFSNELLVLLDGRSVYTPTFDGVFWDVLDIPLEDIDRIEVIRGPGASAWATSAVNGVVNIITKRASETPQKFVEALAGNVDQGFVTVQYGGSIGRRTAFRAFTKSLNVSHWPNSAGRDGGDGWNDLRTGFRTDTDISAADTLTLEGDLYRGREGNPSLDATSVGSPSVPTQYEVNLGGGFLQAAWNHTYSARGGISMQASYDEYERNDLLGETRGTSDVTLQHHFRWGDRQDLVWGVEYRYSQSSTVGSQFVALEPSDLTTNLFSGFVQDEIALLANRLHLTVGTKLEHDNYTGFDALPTARLAWTPSTRQTLWAAVTKADRAPASIDESLRASLGGFTTPSGPAELVLTGNPNVKTERMVGYEAGYRTPITEQLSLDFAAYYNRYKSQEITEPGTPFFEAGPPPHVIIPLILENLMNGETHGFETAIHWRPASRWTLSSGYAFEQIHMHLLPTSQDTDSVGEAEGSTPVNSAQLRSHVEVAKRLSWDTSAYFVGRLTDPAIASYTRLDTGLTLHWNKRLSLRVVGQNLLKDHHDEFVEPTGSAGTTLIKRSAYGEWEWKF